VYENAYVHKTAIGQLVIMYIRAIEKRHLNSPQLNMKGVLKNE